MVVDTLDATLVCARERVDEVGRVVEALREIGAEEIITPGGRASLQRHRHRSEHWIVVRWATISARTT